jgi:hypothetical protein
MSDNSAAYSLIEPRILYGSKWPDESNRNPELISCSWTGCSGAIFATCILMEVLNIKSSLHTYGCFCGPVLVFLTTNALSVNFFSVFSWCN